MPILEIRNLGEFGIITDQLPHDLPINALTGGQNVRVRDSKIQKIKGEEEYLDPASGSGTWDGGSNGQVYWALPVADGVNYYWIYCGLNDVRVYNGTTDKEITRAAGAGGDYAATADKNWTGGIIGGVPVINNGIDDPQEWDKDFATPGTLTDLTAWPASTTCAAMRVFKNYLIAMDVTKSGSENPTLVKWSDSATVGFAPASWDETDATTDAGEVDLAEKTIDISTGRVLDGASLRDIFIIYKDCQTYGMQFIGGNEIFRFYQISTTQGMITRRCAQEFRGRHFVVGNADIFVHDGNTVESVISNRRKRFFYADIDQNNYERTYTYHNFAESEIWVCYVSNDSSDGLPDKAMIWNYNHNTWMVRDMTSVPHISRGIVDTTIATDDWTVADGTWEPWNDPWASIAFNPADQSPLLCSTKLLKGDSTDQFDGTNYTAQIERLFLPIGGPRDIVRIKRIYPLMDGDGTVDISIGSHMRIDDTAAYDSAKTFIIGTDRKIDVNLTCAYMAWKITSKNNNNWSISGMDIEYEIVGQR